MENATEEMPLTVILPVFAVLGLISASALWLWLERGTAILLDLSGLAAAFICL